MPVIGELNDCWELVVNPVVPPRGIVAGFDLRTYATIHKVGKRTWRLNVMTPNMIQHETTTHRTLKAAKAVGLMTVTFIVAEGVTK